MHEMTRLLPDEGQIAYFSMEYAYADVLKTYSGGLGFLAGSHMRSAWKLGQPVVAIGILWSYGYYEQVRKPDQSMGVVYTTHDYPFLQPTDLRFQVRINQQLVWVTAHFLPPTTFQTAPTYFLSTDLPENDSFARSISHRLYTDDPLVRLAASVLLGIGGGRLLELLGIKPRIYHLNESHPLPVAFLLYEQWGNLAVVQQRLVFTTHTAEEAGNPKTDIHQLVQAGFFGALSPEQVRQITGIEGDSFNWALGALRLCGKANAVSTRHQRICQQLWQNYSKLCPILAITNAQNADYWANKSLLKAVNEQDLSAAVAHKTACKQVLVATVAQQTGKQFDPACCTMVWARRFADYKRADLLLHDPERFRRLLNHPRYPLQLIWAGKPFPNDQTSIDLFDHLLELTGQLPNCAVLVDYELHLSKLLKAGADLWLNTPRLNHEASGTSGMSAAMNGAINVSTNDGWLPEFARSGVNSFILPEVDTQLSPAEQDARDAEQLYQLLETTILPTYYEQPDRWQQLVRTSMQDILPYFDSDRLSQEYAEKLYR